MKTAIAICGSSGIDYVMKDHGYYSFRSILIIDEKEYVDYEEITGEEVYQRMMAKSRVKSAQTPTGTLVTLLEKIRDDGYDSVIMICISSGLSGTLSGIHTAASMVNGIKVYPFDSFFIGYPLIKMANYARSELNKGTSIEVILNELADFRNSIKVFFIVDNVQFLVNNGRLSVAKGLLATLLNIKPILCNNESKGTLELYKTVRAKRKAIKEMISDFYKLPNPNEYETFILYSDGFNEAVELQNTIIELGYEKAPIFVIPPVIGLHVGPGTLAIGRIKKIG